MGNSFLWSKQLKQDIGTLVVDQSLSDSAMYEHGCLENIKNLHKHAGNCDYQQQYKDILESDMVSNHEGFTDDIPMSTGPYVTLKKPSTRKSLCQFSQVLDVKQNTTIYRLGAAK